MHETLDECHPGRPRSGLSGTYSAPVVKVDPGRVRCAALRDDNHYVVEPTGRTALLQKAVRIEVDRQAHRARDLYPGAPGRQEALQVDAPIGAHQETLAAAPAHQAERRGG